jgi:hypothetical protein
LFPADTTAVNFLKSLEADGCLLKHVKLVIGRMSAAEMFYEEIREDAADMANGTVDINEGFQQHPRERWVDDAKVPVNQSQLEEESSLYNDEDSPLDDGTSSVIEG